MEKAQFNQSCYYQLEIIQILPRKDSQITISPTKGDSSFLIG